MNMPTRRGADRRRLAAALIGVIALIAVTSCEDSVTNPADLAGVWRLQSLRVAGGPLLVPSDPGRFTVEFGADGRVSVRADCNNCGGRYTAGARALVISNLICTLIACPSAPLDTQYVGILEGTSDFELEEARLTLRSSRGELRFAR